MKSQAHTNARSSVLSPADFRTRLGVSSTTFWRMRRAGDIPEPIQISKRRIGWTEEVYEEWVAARPVATLDRGAA